MKWFFQPKNFWHYVSSTKFQNMVKEMMIKVSCITCLEEYCITSIWVSLKDKNLGYKANHLDKHEKLLISLSALIELSLNTLIILLWLCALKY